MSPRSAGLTLALAVLVAGCDLELPWTRASKPLTDAADVLDAAAEGRIVAYLERVRRDRGIDYQVVIESLGGESIEERSHRSFDERAVGEKTGGRGLVLLVDPEAQQVRVEVGHELGSNFTDLAASGRLAELLAPYFHSGDTPAGIEASIPALIETLGPNPAAAGSDGVDVAAAPQSGGAAIEPPPRAPDAIVWNPAEVEDQHEAPGPADQVAPGDAIAGAEPTSSIERLRQIPDGALDEAAKATLRDIMVPQSDPRKSRDLEIALLHKGIYYRDVPLYDGAWRNAHVPKGWDPGRLREMARQWDRPYQVEVRGSRAVAYYEDAPELGPTFLRRKSGGWMIDGSQTAKVIIYDHSKASWYALDQGSPYLEILESVLALRRVTLSGGKPAWQLETDR